MGGGLQAKYMLSCCCTCDSILFDMQPDHVLKKFNFDLFTKSTGQVDLQDKYLLPCCCIRESLEFDMQHDFVLKTLNFDLLTPPKST